MILQGLLATAEHGINRLLRMDATALPRLDRLSGKVIAIECSSPALKLFVLPGGEGLMLAAQWEGGADCTLRAPATSLVRLGLAKDKTAVLHGPDVDLDGDSHALMELAAILQDLDLDWEYELSRWLGPVGASLVGGHLRSRARWTRQTVESLGQSLSEYLAEESRTLVGHHEAEARFGEIDQARQELERLEARFERLVRSLEPRREA